MLQRTIIECVHWYRGPFLNAFIVTEDHYWMHSLLQRTIIECLRVLINSFFASNDICCPLKFFANSLDLRSGPKFFHSWSGTKLFDALIVFQKSFLDEFHFEKVRRWQQKHENWLIYRMEMYFISAKRNGIYEPWHEISNNNVVCATSKGSDQPAHTRILIRAFASSLNILWLLSYWPNIIWVSKLKRRLHQLVWVYTCQNATWLEIMAPLWPSSWDFGTYRIWVLYDFGYCKGGTSWMHN